MSEASSFKYPRKFVQTVWSVFHLNFKLLRLSKVKEAKKNRRLRGARGCWLFAILTDSAWFEPTGTHLPPGDPPPAPKRRGDGRWKTASLGRWTKIHINLSSVFHHTSICLWFSEHQTHPSAFRVRTSNTWHLVLCPMLSALKLSILLLPGFPPSVACHLPSIVHRPSEVVFPLPSVSWIRRSKMPLSVRRISPEPWNLFTAIRCLNYRNASHLVKTIFPNVA